MGLNRCEAVVLKSHKLGEYDKIVTLFSREEGKLRGVAKGARKLKQRFGSAFEPLTHIRMEYFEKGSGDLVRIENVELIRSYFPFGGRAATVGALEGIAEIADGFAQERQASEPLFRLLLASADAATTADPIAALAYFEIWSLRIAGLLPSPVRCSGCGRIVANSESLHADPEMRGLKCEHCCARRLATLGPAERLFLLDSLRTPPLEMASGTRAMAAASLRDYLSQAVEHALGRKVQSYQIL